MSHSYGLLDARATRLPDVVRDRNYAFRTTGREMVPDRLVMDLMHLPDVTPQLHGLGLLQADAEPLPEMDPGMEDALPEGLMTLEPDHPDAGHGMPVAVEQMNGFGTVAVDPNNPGGATSGDGTGDVTMPPVLGDRTPPAKPSTVNPLMLAAGAYLVWRWLK